jgi:hypothetical protein
MEYEAIFRSIEIPISVPGCVVITNKNQEKKIYMDSKSEQNVHDYVPTLVKKQMCQVHISLFMLHEGWRFAFSSNVCRLLWLYYPCRP